MNLKQKSRTSSPIWSMVYLVLVLFGLNACALSKNLNKTLGNIDTTNIKNLTRAAGNGLISGIDLNALKTDQVLKGLLQGLDTLVNQELDGIRLNALQKRLAFALDSILTSTVSDTTKFKLLQRQLGGLLSTVISGLEKDLNSLDLSPANQKLRNDLAALRDELLGAKTAAQLGFVLNTALDSIAQGGALVSITTKIDDILDDANKKADQQMKSLRSTINRLVYGLIGLGVVIFLIVVYAFWKRRQLQQYKELSVVLTKGIDQISNQAEYDRVRNVISSEADARQVRSNLNTVLKENKGEYLKKNQYANYSDRTLELFREALNGNQEVRNRILAQAQTDPELLNFIQQKLNKPQSIN
ncbi:MAG: hypothetical protein SFV55_22895 [Haliscomenobacter sp.]|uniref:hypothetical protein n=1 Tax=Haliscomenobacter sp. TaxID=2717303 RepID=UPI0029B71E60|nr:hypothetical protein [Haliscomenobacter sp.]MDX2071293.1 hypothetical protein [Haliscomenobacter sp.]